MPTDAPAATREAPGRKRGPQWLAFGPGLVFLLATVGPRDLVTNSTAGASYGYRLLWTLILIVLARYVVLGATARYVLATGESLLTGYRRAGRWVGWIILGQLLFSRHLSNLYQILLLGTSVDLLVPLPTRLSIPIWGLTFWTLAFGLMHFGRYSAVEKISRPLGIVLGGSLLAAAVLARPDPAAALAGAVVPSFPPEQGVYSYALLLMAMIGSGASSTGNLRYASFVWEKGWRDLSCLKRQRIDLLFSVLGLLATSVLVQIAAAATLKPLGVEVDSPESLVRIFSTIFGEVGRTALGLGLWSVVFTTCLGSNTGSALMAADIWESSIRESGAAPQPPAKRTHYGDSPVYRWCLLYFAVSPLYVVFTDWEPLLLVLIASAVSVLATPITVSVLLWLTTNRKRMGRHTNHWAANVVMVLFILVSLYLTLQNGQDFLGELASAFD